MSAPLVISLGGSVVAPGGVDVKFLRRFVGLVRVLSKSRQIAITCGGGAPARAWVSAARALGVRKDEDLHWIGIRQTTINCELIRAALRIKEPVVTSYHAGSRFRQRVIVASGRRPGGTTDYCAVVLAQALGADTIFNITNVDGVFTSDPRKSRRARLIPTLSWRAFGRLVGTQLTPSMHAPFDPVASRAAATHKIQVVVLGSSIENFRRALNGRSFRGTVIGPR